jgi:hypothetical protein
MLAALLLLLDPATAATVHRVGPDGTIAEAVAAASPGDIVLVERGTYLECLDLADRDVRLMSEEGSGVTVIDCAGGAEAAITAAGQPETALVAGFTVANAGGVGVRLISSGTRVADVRLDGLAVAVDVEGGAPLLQDVTVSGSGGAESAVVAVDADLRVEQSEFSGNYGPEGGALRVEGGSLVLVDVDFEDNGCAGDGGAVSVEDAPVRATRVKLLANTAGDEGGGMAVSGGRVDARGLVLTGNVAVNGGGLWVTGEAELRDVTASGNSAEIGGAVWVKGELVVTDGAFSGNEAVGAGTTWGGAIAMNGDLELHRVALRSNRASRGGAVHAVGGKVTAVSVDSEGNSATYAGGSMLLDGTRSPWFAQSRFARDLTDGVGGGVWASVASGDLVVWRSEFQDHEATLGGGMYVVNAGSAVASARIEGSTFSGSSTTAQCAGACVRSFDLDLRGTTFSGLDAKADGAALLAFGWGGADAVIDDVTFEDVVATDGAVHLSGFGVVDVTDTRFADVVAEGHGAIYADDLARLDISRSRFCGITSTDHAALVSEAAHTTIETSVFSDVSGARVIGVRDGSVRAVTISGATADNSLVHSDGLLTLTGSILSGSAPYAVTSGSGGGLDVWDTLVWGATTASEDGVDAPMDVTIADPGLADPCEDPRPNASSAAWGVTAAADSPIVDADGDGLSAWDGDCDDGDPDAFPGAAEVAADGIDQDCDGSDGADSDGDGHALVPWGGDCDDADATVFPDADEALGDGVDQDCDGKDADADGDGSADGPDCDDSDARVHPGAPDVPWDGVDADCDGRSDWDADRDGLDSTLGGGPDCDDGDPSVPALDEVWYDGIDQDCDGADDYDADGDGFPVASDCDDADPRVNPAATDVHDGRDDDCDGRDAPEEPEPEPKRGCDTPGLAPTWLLLLAVPLIRRRERR